MYRTFNDSLKEDFMYNDLIAEMLSAFYYEAILPLKNIS